MKEHKEDLGEDYIPLISMIGFNDSRYLPQSRPELHPETTLPPKALRTTADIMADILVRKQQGQLRQDIITTSWRRYRRRRRGNIMKESEDILTDSSSITIIIATGHICFPFWWQNDPDQRQASLSHPSFPSSTSSLSCLHQSLTSCLHLTSSQLAKVCISCMVHLSSRSSKLLRVHRALRASYIQGVPAHHVNNNKGSI